ncbi:excitatory amino acid transporter 2-like isoform X2 [Dreissena polymorpha]|uniref:Amino acid transporter n=1 Tax=Dreissena polymorpha TaxID=45954 RepID=A0A9D4FS62_DREPO|nr:excitatory amino acid transporter 2-like isoform X2 [Dreissena polymorpha]XP_052214752.1 excitatory amino acid transporter 2-like isoform X2 [Dreissena polymorpha]XP_052214753.1 excitatory amino acid transporter 2-like isoform X2 [Dreissena polymorpha]KAH3803562.1 hypothetical protein DPMN_131825 [Dreissena polymorpha]
MGTCDKINAFIRDNLSLILTLLGVALGLGVGFAIRPAHPSESVLMWLGLPGQLYLRLLKMMIVPLVVCSVISGTSSLDPKTNGKISMVSFVFIFSNNAIGAILGVLAFIAFKPGNSNQKLVAKSSLLSRSIETQDIFADLLRNLVPDNLFEASIQQTVTTYVPITTLNATSNETITSFKRSLGFNRGPNLLGLIFACTLLGIAAASLRDKGKSVIDFFESATQIVIAVLRWFLWTTPLGVLSLILVAVANIKDVGVIFGDLGMHVLAVTVALLLQQLLIMPLLYLALTKRNPYTLLAAISRALLTSFAATSTAVVLPEMLHACEVKLGADRRIARFVIPFSIALSANGSAVFIACSCLFISNFTGTYPSADIIATVGVLSALAALAIPSVPSASIVTILMILTTLLIPVEPIALLLAVEFFLDRLRTASNTMGHTMGAMVTHTFCKNTIRPLGSSPHDSNEIKLEISRDPSSSGYGSKADVREERNSNGVQTCT